MSVTEVAQHRPCGPAQDMAGGLTPGRV